MSVGLMALATASCSTSPAAPVFLKPVLPVAPETFGVPVPVPLPIKGQSAISYSAKTLGALALANRRLVNDGAFFNDLRKSYEAANDLPR